MHFPSPQVSQAVAYHPRWSSVSWKVISRQQMMSQIFYVHGFGNLMMSSTKNPQRLIRTLLQVQGKHINNHRIPRIEEYLNSFARSTRRFWMGKEFALMKEQEFPTIGGLMAMMILIFQMDLLILTDLLGLLIHLVCLRFEDHRGIQQSIWSPQLLSLLKNLRGYPDEKRTRCTSAHGQAPEFGRLAIWSY